MEFTIDASGIPNVNAFSCMSVPDLMDRILQDLAMDEELAKNFANTLDISPKETKKIADASDSNRFCTILFNNGFTNSNSVIRLLRRTARSVTLNNITNMLVAWTIASSSSWKADFEEMGVTIVNYQPKK